MSAGGVARKLAALVRGRRMDRELDNEIEAHLEMAERDALSRGMSAEEARRAARQSFGGIAKVREEHRDQRSFRWIETIVKDVRHGAAGLLRAPAFTAIVTAVLAIGIGANAAMFSVMDAVLFRPLPFPDPDRIVRVWEAPRPGVVNAASGTEFQDWKRLGGVFEAMSAEIPVSVTLANQNERARLAGKAVTAEYFRVFGVKARLGRTFTADEDRPGGERVIVLSHAAWQSVFGGDPDILTKRPVLDGEPYAVAGVLEPGAFDRDAAKFWKPLALSPDQMSPEMHWLTVYARLSKGVTVAQADDRMHSINAALLPEKPAADREGTVRVAPLAQLLVGGGLTRTIHIAFGAVTLVLLIACANVVNLLLTRGALREKELAVRAALGASRGRMIAQLLTESMVLCGLGGVAGVVMASLLIRVAQPLLADALPFTAGVELDWRVLGFAAAVALGVGVLTGTLPAIRASFANHLAGSLNHGARGSSGGHARTRRLIVAGEVALSMVLLCGALLLFRSLSKLHQIETGVDIENVITMSTDLPAGVYPSPAKAAAFYEALGQRLRAVPGVTQSGLATQLPLRWITNGEGLIVPGSERIVRARLKRVDPGYFGTFKIPMAAGRGIEERDRDGAARVIVINQALAAQLREAGIADPVGKVVRASLPLYVRNQPFLPPVEIVGVIRNERVSGPGEPAPPVMYAPLAQSPAAAVKVVVRTSMAPGSAMPAIREAFRDVAPQLSVADVATMEEVRERTLSGTSRPAGVIGVFAAVAMLLTAAGLYGVLSQTVAQRRREIGIRMAMGARPADVLREVMGNALGLVLVGLAAGLAGAVAATRVMKNLLFEVSPVDPVVFAGAGVAMAVVGMMAGFVPARRAAGVDPVVTLRDEG